MKYFTQTLFLCIFISILPHRSDAQMFSADNTSQTRQVVLGTSTIFSLGWDFAEFENRQDDISLSDDYSFTDQIVRMSLGSPGIDIGLGFGGSITGMNNHSYFNVMGRLHNKLFLYQNDDRAFLLRLPLQITTDMKRIQRNEIDSEFQQSSFIFGTGIAADIRFSDTVDFSIKTTPNYGFSFSQGNLFGGSLFRFDGQTRLLIHNLFGDRGLAFGYHFDFRRYDIDGDQNDYDFLSHSISIGLVF